MAVRPYDMILAEAGRRYPDRVGVALIEGLAPLARIAYTARIARRVLRFFPLKIDSTRTVLEGAVRAAEKAASGDPLTEAEANAARDKSVLEVCDLESSQGGQQAATAGGVARMAARCVCGPEVTFGESALLALFDLARVVESFCRICGVSGSAKGHAKDEMIAAQADLRKLLIFAEQSKEPWILPDLDSSFEVDQRSAWVRLLKAHNIAVAQRDGNRLRWQKIHEALRQAEGIFYPRRLFGPITPKMYTK